ncbi:polyprotein [Canna indica]|uniref:Polyprotein n=1 Tax=Canna indica TaxID=4628 RepID=A0AAQ3JWU6_9LILI|nr:polyprotein [Canna indica]
MMPYHGTLQLHERKKLKEEIEVLKSQVDIEDLEEEFHNLSLEEERNRKGKFPAIEKEPVAREAQKGIIFKESESANKLSASTSKLPQEYASIADKIDQPKGKRILNRLYNMVIIMEIPQVKSFKVQAILDTGATVCCIDQDSIPEEALEPSAYPILINGVNSQQLASKKLKSGYMSIEENRFPIPFTYSFPMGKKDGIQMLIGCNFIRSMKGGVRIEEQSITFYKKVTTITTRTDTEVSAVASIDEFNLTEEEYMEVLNATAYDNFKESEKFQQRFKPLLKKLKDQGYIGENPIAHWGKNQVTCKIDIINPDLTIQDKPLKHVTPAMKDQFSKHIQSLLQIGAIRPSSSIPPP